MNIKEFTVEGLLAEGRELRRDDFVFFWKTCRPGTLDKGCMSQWYMSDFVVDGQTYNCAEQYMMSEKARLFGDMDTYGRIMMSRSPRTLKSLGRQVSDFDPLIWDENKRGIVYRANVAKFTQRDDLRQFLAGTGDRILVEASPYDRIWGIGLGEESPQACDPAMWRGQNLLGFVLMEVRQSIAEGGCE